MTSTLLTCAHETHHTRPKVLSNIDYSWVLDDPEPFGLSVGSQHPLPRLDEPVAGRVTAPCNEPLVTLRHRRIRTPAPYWHAGWASAAPDVYVRSGVAEALDVVLANLPEPFGLAVLDAWRPLELQAEIYDVAYSDPVLPPGFVSVPSLDPQTPPPHATGGTVDVSLTWNGRPLRLGTDYDDFTDDARAAAFEDRPGLICDLRRFLYWHMRAAGFVVIDCEWWHFELGTRRWAAITGGTARYDAITP